MTATAHHTTTPITHADRVILLIEYHTAKAAQAATVRSRGVWRVRVLRRQAQLRFNQAWGLR